MFDWLSQSLSWIKKRWGEDWNDFGKTFTESWTSLPKQVAGINAGIIGMATAPFKDDGDFWGSAKLWIDSSIGAGGSVMGGTLGTVFQVPLLHEASWLLDKAYRFGLARPISTSFRFQSNVYREAYRQGQNPLATLWEHLSEWKHIQRAWEDSEYVTPGQAIVHYGDMTIRSLGGIEDAMRWADENDPRTPEGQAKFNSPDAEFGLKYGSGSIDFAANLVADPGHGLASVTKLAKARVQKVATANYVVERKVHQEVGTKAYKDVFNLANEKDMTPEKLRDLTMPDARFGGQISNMLWHAARMGEEVYRHTYLAIRAFDVDALARLEQIAPKIAADFGDMFANFTIADWDFQRGMIESLFGADALRRTKAEAFVDSFAAGEGLWGGALGLGVGEKMPKVRAASRLRQGIHSYILHSAPILIARPLANAMVSQGHTPIIDANDPTGISVKQFKANLERANTAKDFKDSLVTRRRQLTDEEKKQGFAKIDPKAHKPILTELEINQWTSRFGAATSDASRQAIAMQIDNTIVARILRRHGIAKDNLPRVLEEINRWRTGTRRIFANGRLFMSHEAQRAADRAVQSGLLDRAKEFQELSKTLKEQGDAGLLMDEHVMLPDEFGRLALQPVARSQFTEIITMLDYRNLNAALRWWKMMHPKPKALTDPADIAKRIPDDSKWVLDGETITGKELKATERFEVMNLPLSKWEIAFAQAAKARGWYEGFVLNPLDALMSAWKATALFRPAQAPRNVASDILLAIAAFGKLPMLLATTNIVPNAIRNFGPRGKLLVEAIGESLAKARGKGRARRVVTVDVDNAPPGGMKPGGKIPHYTDIANMYADGWITIHDYARHMEMLFTRRVDAFSKGAGIFGTPKAAKPIEVPPLPQFVPSTTLKQMGKPETPAPSPKKKPAQQDKTTVPPRLPDDGTPQHEDISMPRTKAHPEGWTERRDVKPPDPEYLPGREPEGFGVGKGGARNRPAVGTPYTGGLPPGAPYFVERTLYEQYRQGIIETYDEYLSKLAREALRRSNKSWYFGQRKNGIPLLQELVMSHLNRKSDPGYRDEPFAPGTILVSPFNGKRPNMPMGDLRKHYDITSESVLKARNVKGRLGVRAGTSESVQYTEIYDQLKGWIHANADNLLQKGTMMALRVKPDGNIGVGFATAKRQALDEVAPEAGAWTRLRNFRYGDIADMAHTGLEFRNTDGAVIARLDGWADGATGQLMQRRISARDNPTTGFGGVVDDISVEDLLDEQGAMRSLRAREDAAEYPSNFERDVNAQIASDPVMRLLLERKSNGKYKTADDAIATVEDTTWGQKWVRNMSFTGVDYFNHIKGLEAWVNTYLPNPEFLPSHLPDSAVEAAHRLRYAAYNKRATYAMLEDVFRDAKGNVLLDDMPEIHGQSLLHATGNARAWKFMRRTVRKVQRLISDMPVDKWARFPVMSMVYKRHSAELIDIANKHFVDGPIPAKIVDHIQNMARERAYHDVRYYLYDTAQRNDFAYAARLFMPFSAAMMDAYVKYGRAIKENPAVLAQGAYYWDLFERNEMIQDEEGNVAVQEFGHTAWYSVDPTTGERTRVPEGQEGKHRYIQFQLPSGLARAVGRKYYGVDANPVIAINKDTMNVFLQAPSGGPLAALPANEFALSNPEFGEKELVRKYLLPYGPSSDRSRAVMPSTVRTAWEAFMEDDGDRAQGHAAAIMQAELIAYGLGTRNQPPTFQEAREKAGGMLMLRFMSTMISPASFQVESPYQPYVDAYRQLLANPETKDRAAEEFMRRHGDEFYAVMLSVTRNNAGLSATLESSAAYDKYRDLIQKYPEFGGLIVGAEGAGAFAKSVYEQQKTTPVGPGDPRTLRELMGLEESVRDLNTKTTWSQYSQMMDLLTAAMVDRGVRNLRNRGAEDLLARKEAFVEKYKYWIDPNTGKTALSPWYIEYKNSDEGNFEHKLEALRAIASDEKLWQRDDIRGLQEYLELRDRMQAEMANWRIKSLDAEKAWGLRNKWAQQVHDLVESNGAFGDLWNRWLSNDDKLDLPMVTIPTARGGGYAS